MYIALHFILAAKLRMFGQQLDGQPKFAQISMEAGIFTLSMEIIVVD